MNAVYAVFTSAGLHGLYRIKKTAEAKAVNLSKQFDIDSWVEHWSVVDD